MLTVLYCCPTVAEQSNTAFSPLVTLTLPGMVFQMGGWENTGAGKLVSMVVC